METLKIYKITPKYCQGKDFKYKVAIVFAYNELSAKRIHPDGRGYSLAESKESGIAWPNDFNLVDATLLGRAAKGFQPGTVNCIVSQV